MGKFHSKWVILIVLAITWGSSFILIKKSLEVFSAFQIGSVRVALSGFIFLGIGLPAIKEMDRKTMGWMILAGALGNFIPMYFFPLAQTRITSSMAGILDSLVPVFVLIFGFILFKIKSKTLQWYGAILGFLGAGILMYFSGSSEGGSDPVYAMLVVLATACYAISALVINRKLAHVSSLKLSAGVFTFWMVPSVVILLFTGISAIRWHTPEVWTGAGYLGILSVVGTALAILLYFKLIQTVSAVFASMVTYLLPLVAVFWGLLAGEKFSAWYALGGILILLGIYMVQDKKELEKEIDEIEKESKQNQ